ncbi:MAG: M48 family metallopeptidase [Pyrinomonadaceae bacterium]
MIEQNNTAIVCRNGHRQTVSNSKFCIYCGTALNNSSAPPSNQISPNPQPNQSPATPPIPVKPPSQISVPPVQPPPVNQNQPPQNFQPPQSNNPPFQQPFQQPNNYPPQYENHHQPSLPIQYQQPPAQMIRALDCYTCGGNGQNLNEKTIICKDCNWLRPLVPGYQVDSTAFEWAADGKAMAALRAIKPLNAVAKVVSEKVGRRWIESTFNSVLLSEKQLPQIYGAAVQAARILGMTNMPDVYISGERSWDCLTFGTDRDSFVVIGSALASNFQGADLFFLLAREMGHCRAGHALWKTVIRFFLGEQGPAKGFMAGGIFNAILSPTALISSAIELPLLAWARQAEITADRAGLLTVGDEEVARRVLLTWSLKSAYIYRQINIEAWLEQQAADDDGYSKLSELTTTSTPYLTPRLKLLTAFAKSQELQHWRKMISAAIKKAAPESPPQSPQVPQSAAPSDVVKLKCATCQSPMRVPLKVLAGKTELPVKCPKCGKITRLKKSVKPAEKASDAPPPKIKKEENLNYGDQ